MAVKQNLRINNGSESKGVDGKVAAKVTLTLDWPHWWTLSCCGGHGAVVSGGGISSDEGSVVCPPVVWCPRHWSSDHHVILARWMPQKLENKKNERKTGEATWRELVRPCKPSGKWCTTDLDIQMVKRKKKEKRQNTNFSGIIQNVCTFLW